MQTLLCEESSAHACEDRVFPDAVVRVGLAKFKRSVAQPLEDVSDLPLCILWHRSIEYRRQCSVRPDVQQAGRRVLLARNARSRLWRGHFTALD